MKKLKKKQKFETVLPRNIRPGDEIFCGKTGDHLYKVIKCEISSNGDIPGYRIDIDEGYQIFASGDSWFKRLLK